MLIGFDRIADEMSALVFTATPDGELDWVNRWGVEYLDAGDRSAVAERWMDWIHPDDVNMVLAGRDDSVASGETYERAQRFLRHDGEYRWHWVSVRPVLDDDGAVELWVGVAVDAHDRLMAERELAHDEERFRRLAEVVADVVFDWDVVADRVWFSNDLAVLGGEGMPSWDDGASIETLLDFVHPEDVERVRADLLAVVDSEPTVSSWTTSCRGVRADGTVLALTARGAVIHDVSGRAIRLIGSLEDRSAQQRLERRLARSQHLDTFAELASGLAHELNNVFAVATLAIGQLVSELDDRPELRELVSMASEATRRGTSLIDDLVTFAGGQQLAFTSVDVRAALNSVAGLGRQAFGRGISFEVHCEPGVGSVWTDADRFESALFNICLNASDAMPDGGRITMRAFDVSVADDVMSGANSLAGDYVQIDVADDGVGMNPEVLARAVEPMFTTKGRATHPGLGLSAAHGVVVQSGGHLSITSEEHHGTTVSLWLPRDVGASAPVPRTDAPAAPVSTAPPPTS